MLWNCQRATAQRHQGGGPYTRSVHLVDQGLLRSSSPTIGSQFLFRCPNSECVQPTRQTDQPRECRQLRAGRNPIRQTVEADHPAAPLLRPYRMTARIAKAGIYDLRIHHDDILWPLLRHWRVFERTDLERALSL